MFVRFLYPELFFVLIPLFVGVFIYYVWWRPSPRYVYPLTGSLAGTSRSSARWILTLLRSLVLLGLIILIARPQVVDERSKIPVEGVAIVVALDVSGSMQLFDDPHDRRSRVEVAKTEAIRFIEKRIDDPIGVVIFGNEVLTRCPLTLDKHILKEIIAKVAIGDVDAEGTALGSGLAMSINRLRKSTAKSKIVILLTDGVPQGDVIAPDTAIELAKQFGVKVYTIGIGRPGGGYLEAYGGNIVQAQDSVDMTLLEKIARETKGKAFRADNPKQLRAIYDHIDLLEKTVQETSMYHQFYELFTRLIWVVMLLLCMEIGLRSLYFRGI